MFQFSWQNYKTLHKSIFKGEAAVDIGLGPGLGRWLDLGWPGLAWPLPGRTLIKSGCWQSKRKNFRTNSWALFLSWLRLWLWWCWHEAQPLASWMLQLFHFSYRTSCRATSHRIARNPFQANGLRLYRVQFISSVFHVAPWLKLKTHDRRSWSRRKRRRRRRWRRLCRRKSRTRQEDEILVKCLLRCCLCDFSFGSGHARIGCAECLYKCECVCAPGCGKKANL